MEVPNTPGSGKCIAKAKGVRGDEESKGRRRQISGPTNRNRIRQALRIRLPVKPKSNSYTESANVDAADRWRERLCSYPGRSRKRERVDIFESERSNNELREVSRGHSTIGEKWEGPNNRKSEERTKGGQCDESRIS